MSTRGEGESIFEEWAVQHDVEIKRIQEASRKRPDYWVMCPGGTCIVEVKDLAPNPEEQVFERKLEAKGRAIHASTPGKRLRKPLREANRQHACFSKLGISCVTFVFNSTKIPSSTDSVNVFAAMSGQLSFSVPVDRPEGEAMVMAEKGVMTPDRNTSTSAVAVNEWDRRTGFTMIVYHNPYAKNPLDPHHVASIQGVRQFRMRREGQPGFWVEI